MSSVDICVMMYMYMPTAGVHKFKILGLSGDKFLYSAAYNFWVLRMEISTCQTSGA